MYGVLFDLDDTLYPEFSYVKSGFRAVARTLTSDTTTQDVLVTEMLELFASSPSGVFDRLLERFSHTDWARDASKSISRMLHAYRTHSPDIELYADVVPTISLLRWHGMKLGVITDGRADGQHAKLDALGVSRLVDVVIVTDSLGPGRRYWKPSTRPFELALSELGVAAANAVYVGDNPSKDFHGPSRLGMRTVHIRRSDALNLYEQKAVGGQNWLHADHVIDDLDDLPRLLQEWSWLD